MTASAPLEIQEGMQCLEDALSRGAPCGAWSNDIYNVGAAQLTAPCLGSSAGVSGSPKAGERRKRPAYEASRHVFDIHGWALGDTTRVPDGEKAALGPPPGAAAPPRWPLTLWLCSSHSCSSSSQTLMRFRSSSCFEADRRSPLGSRVPMMSNHTGQPSRS